MTFVIIFACVLAVAVLIFAFWALALMPRRSHAFAARMAQTRFAHRGLFDNASERPENSLAAFELAAKKGFGIELDVHLSVSGELVVIHDRSLLRACGVDAPTASLWRKGRESLRLFGTNERIPLLSEVLGLVRGRVPLLVELKPDGANRRELTLAALSLLRGYDGEYCVESFDPRVLLHLKRFAPEVMRGQLATNFHRDGERVSHLGSFALSNLLTTFITGPDFIAYKYAHRRCASLRLSRALWKTPVFLWTIKTPHELRQCEKEGCAAIFEGFDPGERE